MAVIPSTITIFAVLRVVKVRTEVQSLVVEDVKVGIEEHGEASDRALLNIPVSDGTILVDTAILVMLRIVSQRSKNLDGYILFRTGKLRGMRRKCTHWDLHAHAYIIHRDL